ncbi:MAG: hypothetical protein JWR51_1608 [Devosia sp.]|uniref:hypothetical protein n=1 Tax=Devosia sp. TaxID=1871048 RepID=UPI00260984C4|nr:hypothetical protein [Devosia sp.]MDB5528505.1 hypothetical protein [Devosia sp.]
MTFDILSRPKLAAFAAACLLTVALPTGTAIAKEKIKAPAEQSTPVVTTPPEFTVEIPSVNAVGSNVDDTTLRAIFSGDLVENADALAGLTATSITIPEIILSFTSTVDGTDKSGTVTFKDVALDNVEDGVAASVSLGGAELTADEDVSGSFGAVSATNFDIGGMLAVYGLVDAAGQTELTTLYSDFKSAGGSLAVKDVACNVGAIETAEFKGRPLKFSFADIMAMSQTMEAEGETPSPETIGKALHIYADIFTAFESSPVTFGGFDCKGTDENGTPLDFAMGGMTMDGMAPGTYPAIAMQDFRIAVEGDGEMSMSNIAFKAMDLSGPIATVEAAPEAIDQAWLDANARSLIPAFAGFSFDGFKMDIPNPDAADQRVKADIGAFDLSLSDYLNGIPTNISTTGDSIVVDVPKDSGDEQFQQLIDLGITSIDVGFAVKAAWDEATNAINIEDVSVSGADLATVKLAGTIGNATEALFDIDPDTSLAAAMGVVINNLKVNVVDAGLADIILKRVSTEQGSDAATMRPIYAGLAEGTILGMLAGAAEAQKVGKAVSAFISGDAKALTIEMTAKDPAGLGLADFMAAQEDPTVLLQKTNISATSE